LTNNGISVYYAAKNSQDAKVKEMAADIDHANFPIGPVGRPTEWHLFFPQMIFKYTKFPNAAKAYLAFMMEKEQYEPWQAASIGYVTHPLVGYEGESNYASAACIADFIMVNMVAEAASGSKTPKEAAERAAQRAMRYYK